MNWYKIKKEKQCIGLPTESLSQKIDTEKNIYSMNSANYDLVRSLL